MKENVDAFIAQLIAFTVSSCILPAVKISQRKKKKTFYIIEENIESVKDGTCWGPFRSILLSSVRCVFTLYSCTPINMV